MNSGKERIVAVGAGRMGRGIAHVFAYAGYPVTLLDLKARPKADSTRLLGDAKAEIAGNLNFLASLNVLSELQADEVLGRVKFADADVATGVLAQADIIFEGVPETLQAKQEALHHMSHLASEGTIIASTTSTMLVNTLAQFVKDRTVFLNAHWLNPAYLIPLVEVSPGEATAPRVIDRLMALLTRVGKVPVRCKAAPGYIVPRIQCAAMNEAARLVEEGIASPEDIDQAIRVGFGLRYSVMGLLEFIDWGGVDILYYASNYLQQALDSDRYAAPPVIGQMMREDRTGLRAGQGFYDFRAMDVVAYQREVLTRFVALLQSQNLLPPPAGR
jgi:3-hydroxybutyryl-CoA dehydrogenase